MHTLVAVTTTEYIRGLNTKSLKFVSDHHQHHKQSHHSESQLNPSTTHTIYSFTANPITEISNTATMQFFTIATLLFTAASGVMGAPAPAPVSSSAEPSHLQARTCGTLTGKPLEVCQGVCKAACVSFPLSSPRPSV